ncbi:MAG: ATP-grasp domain-containing protein [Desulfobulbaceae bacterium]|nr:ATP-grasp domain-containing protein [Desulfobulbaceae bacterium]
MHSKDKVLVVGTTADYIHWIRQANPGRAIFLTAPEIRHPANEANPHPVEEILCDLEEPSHALHELINHLQNWDLTVNGIACFDCESLELAAYLAMELNLPYPSVESIRLCRDKFVTKTIWRKNQIPCPRVKLVQSAGDVSDFLMELDAPCVLKPVTGSGSELVFRCSTRKDCDQGTRLILKELKNRKSDRLYRSMTTWFVVEECLRGDEFSCDFFIRNNSVRIIRLTKKIKDPDKPFGTISAYMLSDCKTEGLDKNALERILCRAAGALGVSEAICMVDFIACGGEISLLEMTPRPGGDCLPFLLKQSMALDILTYTLDFAQRKKSSLPKSNGRYAALRFHANCPGKITKINDNLLQQDSRVIEIHRLRQPGHHVTMPPHDYESWYLGHVIFKPFPDIDLDVQTRELSQSLNVVMENDGHSF